MQIEKGNMQGYIDLYVELQNKLGDEHIAMLILEQVAKDARMNAIAARDNSNGESNGESHPATEKQIGFLKRLGVSVPVGLSKREASRMIDEAQIAKAA